MEDLVVREEVPDLVILRWKAIMANRSDEVTMAMAGMDRRRKGQKIPISSSIR